MRVLHEEVIARLAILSEARNGKTDPDSGKRTKRRRPH